MSNPNPNPNPQPQGGNSGPKLPVTAFNMQGWAPRVCVFRPTVEEFCDAVLKIAKNYIDDFQHCSYENGQNGHKALLLWLRADSSHLVDKSSTNGTILRRAVKHTSPQMKEFLNKFCRARDRDGSPEIRDSHFRYGEILALDRYNDASDRNMTAIVVNPKSFVDAMFDINGQGYQSKYGGRAPSTMVEFRYIYRERDGKRGSMIGVEITKRNRDPLNNRDLHTKFAVHNN